MTFLHHGPPHLTIIFLEKHLMPSPSIFQPACINVRSKNVTKHFLITVIADFRSFRTCPQLQKGQTFLFQVHKGLLKSDRKRCDS